MTHWALAAFTHGFQESSAIIFKAWEGGDLMSVRPGKAGFPGV